MSGWATQTRLVRVLVLAKLATPPSAFARSPFSAGVNWLCNPIVPPPPCKKASPAALVPGDTHGVNQRGLFALLLTIPPLAVLLVAVVWFVGRWGAPRWTAKVWSASTEPGHVLVKAQLTSFPDRRLPGRAVEVGIILSPIFPDYGQPRRLYGQTDREGFVTFEARLSDNRNTHELSLQADGEPVSGNAVLHTRYAEVLSVEDTSTIVHLKPEGLRVEVDLRHGVLTVPVSDDLRLSWPATNPEAAPSKVTVDLDGALGPAGTQTFDVSSGEWVRITPTEHVVEVGLRAQGVSGVNSGFGVLRLVPGAIAARLRDDGVVQVISPVPRSEVYVAIATAARVYALERVAVAPVTSANVGPDTRVRFEGAVQLTAEARRVLEQEGVWAVTSGEPDLLSEARVGWPLNRWAEGRTLKFAWGAVFDGFQDQAERNAVWLRDLRFFAWFGLLGAGIVELIVLYALVRRTASVDGVDASLANSTWPWIAVCCVALGFAGLGSLFGFW
jgi:hypothetical protein